MTNAEGLVLRLRGLTKTFPGVRALDGVDLELAAGELHVLFGENGAGKSTLINIVAGALAPDAGTIELQGHGATRLRSVLDARRLGIAAVFQEFSLAPDLTVEENILLGDEPIRHGFVLDRRIARTRVEHVLKRLGFALDPSRRVAGLSRAEQQIVELAKVLLAEPRLLILDEPTASLGDRDTAQLFAIIRDLKRTGIGILYITHRIAEIIAIGDRVTVLRDGRQVGTIPVARASRDTLVEMMTGRKPGELFPVIQHRPGETLLSLESVSTRNGKVREVSLRLRAGEITGLAGLVGCGKSELGRACFGLEPLAGGTIRFAGAPLKRLSPRAMLHRGLCYIPADRRGEGLLLERSLRENLTISALELPSLSRLGILRRGAERSIAGGLAERLHIRPLRLEAQAAVYSGGNQQKIVFARALLHQMRVCIFDEPTTGIDMTARRQIYDFLGELVERGVAVLLISSDVAEIVNLCRRVYVIDHGRVCSEFTDSDIAEDRIVASFFYEK